MTIIIPNTNRAQARRTFNHIAAAMDLYNRNATNTVAHRDAATAQIYRTDDHRFLALTTDAVTLQSEYFTISTLLDALTTEMKARAVVEREDAQGGADYVPALEAEREANAYLN